MMRPHTSAHSMWRLMIVAALVAISMAAPAAAPASAQPAPTGLTQEEAQIYEAFRAWITAQPAEIHRAGDAVVNERYAAELRRQGKSEADVKRTLAALDRISDRAEVEMWNRILTAPTPRFNTAPNAFLVEMVKGVQPGQSLDVGMGQGRNTIYLAQQGWNSVGFDPADRAVAAAQAQAAALGVKITTSVARAEDFDWGAGRWDLIVLSYVGVRGFQDTVLRALKPGGMVVLEAFHRDATKAGPIGDAVVFDTNELLQLFSPLRIIRYEDTMAVADFGRQELRVLRLAAVKP